MHFYPFSFAVTVSLRYGYYGDCRMVLGPSASRLMKASSVFVKQVEVRDDDKKGVLLYGFCEKPELSFETNWSVSKVLIVGSYRRKVKFLSLEIYLLLSISPIIEKINKVGSVLLGIFFVVERRLQDPYEI